MPRESFGPGYEFLAREALLTYEEIARVARAVSTLGVRKIRITGGEPLLRRDLPRLIALLAAIPAIDDIALTTNGVFLAAQAKELKTAGLGRVTVSLDSLDDAVFKKMNDTDVPVAKVLEGIDAAAAAGLRPVKINTVVKRGVNEHTLVDLAARFRGTGHVLRFIEYMDVGRTNGWRLDDVVPAKEIVETIGAAFPLEPLERAYRGETALRWRYRDGAGEIGLVASVSQPFCGDCTRLRMSPEGKLFTCLFATAGHDVRAVVRGGASDEELAASLAAVWGARDDRYSELRSSQTSGLPKIEMSYIGG